MMTYTSSGFNSCENKENITVLRYEQKTRTEGDLMRFISPLFKWFGVLSTIALGVAAFTPNAFNVPLNLRPWIFVTFVFWFVAFCSGLFNS